MRIILFLGLCFLPFGYGDDSVQVEPAALPVRKFDVVCNTNEELCDTRCYNPTTHKCLLPTKGGLHKVCPIDQTLCGNQCWSSSSGGKICTPETDGALGNVCEPGELSCGWNCYKPEEKECFDQHWLCPKGQLLCGNECYSPADPVKCIPSKRGTFLCKADQGICGSWGCYNPKEKTCFEKEDELCPKGHQLCGRDCYNPSAGDTCHNGTYWEMACKAGEKFCRNSCYDPTKGKICANDVLVCNSGETNCGDDGCYVPSSGAQCFEAMKGYYVLCQKGQGYCHFNCYEPKTEACMTMEGDSYKKVCLIGQKICNGKLDDFSWGYGCYDPGSSECLKNKNNSYVLCKKGESLCGTTCYTPTNDGLMCRENGALCKADDKICGQECYDSGTKKCFQDVVSDLQ